MRVHFFQSFLQSYIFVFSKQFQFLSKQVVLHAFITLGKPAIFNSCVLKLTNSDHAQLSQQHLINI